MLGEKRVVSGFQKATVIVRIRIINREYLHHSSEICFVYILINIAPVYFSFVFKSNFELQL